MKIKIFTNQVPGGWSPDKISSLRGSEEIVLHLSQIFRSKGHAVEVFHTRESKETFQSVKGVLFYDRTAFSPDGADCIISFKAPEVWQHSKITSHTKNIHWSCDVELPWDTSKLNHFVCISHYHFSRMVWLDPKIKKWFPLGVNIESIKKNAIGITRDSNQMLYASSFDRGLSTLLNDWDQIKEHYPDLHLKVAYGIEGIRRFGGTSKNQELDRMLKQMDELPDVKYVGSLSTDDIEKEYWRSEYWCLPLNHADSELFCLNAIKARIAGAVPVVNRIGALQNTAPMFIDYNDFVNKKCVHFNVQSKHTVDPIDWNTVYEEHWKQIIER